MLFTGVVQLFGFWAEVSHLSSLVIWAQIAPNVGDLPGAKVGYLQPWLTPCRDIGVSLCWTPRVAAFPFSGIFQQYTPPFSSFP